MRKNFLYIAQNFIQPGIILFTSSTDAWNSSLTLWVLTFNTRVYARNRVGSVTVVKGLKTQEYCEMSNSNYRGRGDIRSATLICTLIARLLLGVLLQHILSLQKFE